MQKSIVIILFLLAIFPCNKGFSSDSLSNLEESSLSIQSLFISSDEVEMCPYVSDIKLTKIIDSTRIETTNAILLKGDSIANCIQWEKLKPCTLKKDFSSISHHSIARADIPKDGVYSIVKIYPNPTPSDYSGSYNDSLDISSTQSLSIDIIKTNWLEKGMRSILLSENLELRYECSLSEKTK